ncbi:Cellulase (glycosyl hydrolase family 5) [Caballeronia cordobensis]|uniref:Cellulase (Glycosyl hydrolase family 5) n=1 Tax=Caballeronia cordobensis TaxID=1353886 RepID=A0A158JNK2_CABCO|nr:Cellulase (glycosyl hydrolase family 5) [Caballeronia cordobensis]
MSLGGLPAHAQEAHTSYASTSVQQGPLRVGVQVKIETFSELDAEKIANAGFAFVRLGVWTDQLDNARYMRRVTAAFSIAARARLPVLLTIRSTVPQIAAGDASPSYLQFVGRQFGARVQTIAQEYAQQLLGIELWNEPDLGRYWPTGDAATTFPPFMSGVCAQIKEPPLHVPVYGFGFSTAPVGDSTASRLLRAALDGSSRCLDAVSYHAYGMTPAQIRNAARELRNRYGLPAVITEWGVPSQGSATSSPAMQARRIGAFVASLDASLDASSIPLFSIYEWKDTARAENARERSFGLVDTDSNAKAALAPVLDYLGESAVRR